MKKFVERYWFIGIVVAVVVTRLPYLRTGYGSDADAWLVAHSASLLWNTGEYLESRLPGYPLHEIVSAPLVGIGGAPLSNGATLIVTIAAVLVWRGIVRHTGQHKRMLVVAFAFAPAVWQHSVVTLDYLWSLLFILISIHSALRQRFIMAGIALGIAAGFRPSNIAAVIPLLVLLYLQKNNAQQIVLFVTATSLTAVSAFIPLLTKYGFPGWIVATQQEMSDIRLSFELHLESFLYRTVYFIGPVTAVIAGYLVWKGRSRLAASIRSRDPVIVASLAGTVTFLLLFLWLPLERAYLLPALPFMLLVIDRYASRRMMALFTASLVLSGLINIDLIDAKDRRKFNINVHSGMVIEEYHLRKDLLDEREMIAAGAYPDSSFIMTRSGPFLWFENRFMEPADRFPLTHTFHYHRDHYRMMKQKGNKEVYFIAYLNGDEVDRVRALQYQVVCLASAQQHVESVVGYSLKSKEIQTQ